MKVLIILELDGMIDFNIAVKEYIIDCIYNIYT